jgi:hypothetical protein
MTLPVFDRDISTDENINRKTIKILMIKYLFLRVLVNFIKENVNPANKIIPKVIPIKNRGYSNMVNMFMSL